jgi:NADPH:quinone reductase-like Zn-dependent oxidoreductase
MKTYELHSGALVPVERGMPAPGRGEVLLQMRAAALNYRDTLVLSGVWPAPAGRIPLSDGVGVVLDVGADVVRVKPGDRVAPIFYPYWTEGPITQDKLRVALGGRSGDGVLTQFKVVSQDAIVRVPSHLSDVEAATLVCAGSVAWHAVAELSPTLPGETVVIQGTGGVSLFALQFAALAGARVIVTSSSDEKLSRARQLGATETINYRADPEWDARVLELTDGRGADHIVEVIGGNHLNRSINAARFGGTVSMVGVIGGVSGDVRTGEIMQKQVRVQGVEVGSRETFENMNRAIASSGMRPVIDRVFSFDEALAAYAHLASGSHFGKIGITFDGD